MEHRRHDHHDEEDAEGERLEEPAGCDDEREGERDDDEVELVDAGEGRTAVAAGSALEKGGGHVAEHRAEGEREDDLGREGREVLDSGRRSHVARDRVECEGEDGPDGGPDGGPAPGLSVAEEALFVPGSSAIDRSPTPREHGHVVGDVRW